MKDSMRGFLIIFGSTFGAIVCTIVLLWVLYPETPEKDRTEDESFFDSFVSAHTDEDIVSYVKKEHDMDVDVIDNYGPENLKSGSGGSARVETNDGVEFDVFINTFGAITGDNYEYLLAIPHIKSTIEDSEEVDEIIASGIDDVTLLTDDESKKLDIILKNSEPFRAVDEQFLEQIFMAYNIVKSWKDMIKSEHDLMIGTLEISYEQDSDDGSAPSRLFVSMDEDFRTIEELEQYLVQRNSRVFTETFLENDMKQLDEIRDQMPEMFDFVADNNEMECIQFASFDTCDTYRLIVGLHEDEDFEAFQQFRYDNEQVIDDLFEITQLIQTLDLPQIELIVEDLYAPEDLGKQNYSEEQLIDKNPDEQFSYLTVEVVDAQQVTSVDQIEFIDD